jgi:hypothetical protein
LSAPNDAFGASAAALAGGPIERIAQRFLAVPPMRAGPFD